MELSSGARVARTRWSRRRVLRVALVDPQKEIPLFQREGRPHEGKLRRHEKM